ncbi:MAG TPA: hypothetical protein VF032_19955 [Thermoleophilaceae bacterium]
MSAFVAFNGFPGEDVQAPIQSLLVQERQAPVPVPAKPVRVGVLAASRHPASAGTNHGGTGTSGHLNSPTASTGPVVQRTAPKTAPPAQSPAPSSGSGTATSVAETAPLPTVGSVPTDPSTIVPQLPTVTVPSLPPPPSDSSLPVDTSGVTSLLGGQ